MSAVKLLVVEDSARLRKSLRTGLGKLGYAVDFAPDGESGRRFALGGDYDVIVLDLMLPRVCGLDILREVRRRARQTEVIILSARDQVEDRIRGLELGADDYLVKPFSFDELHARIQALLRRRYRQKNPVVQIADLTINTAFHQVTVDGETVRLTPTELRILEYLALNRGRVVSPQLLQDHVYDSHNLVSTNTLEVHISSMRRKLRKVTAHEVVKTRRGFGYYVEAHGGEPG